ncbi:MAG: translation initiation factor IF-2 [Candidatus Azambacteria bacterium]|nr:translation initiation factor IF-2 [Candidatus Azambacteria bacterium]
MPNTNAENNNLIPRPPVVVIMGHVDHGKTKLLDYIRKTNVAEHEAGGITQHIGAYEITYKKRKITFLDTPGHEAFSKLRARGAKAADIAILIVAADDGVKPQTIEALEHIKKAGLPFIVAINKIDKSEANTEKVKKELAENDVLVESWGGKVPSVEISAKQGTNVSQLLDLTELLADLNEFKADSQKPGEGIIIETNLDPRRGIAASLLILDGTLKVGDYISSGEATGKIKMLEDFLGEKIKTATFSSPVLAVGFAKLPLIGEKFATSEIPFSPALKIAEKIGEFIEKSLEIEPKEILNSANIIIKADVQSSVEALKESLEKIPLENGAVKILKAEAGNVNENDFKMADLSDALILAFNVKTDSAMSLTEKQKENLISGEIIYDILDRAKIAIEKKLKPKVEREEIGRLNVLAIFRQEKGRQVVGGKVVSGEIVKGIRMEVLRNDAIIGQGRIISLQSEKKEIGKVETGREAGIGIDFGEPKILVGDTIIFFRKTQ